MKDPSSKYGLNPLINFYFLSQLPKIQWNTGCLFCFCFCFFVISPWIWLLSHKQASSSASSTFCLILISFFFPEHWQSLWVISSLCLCSSASSSVHDLPWLCLLTMVHWSFRRRWCRFGLRFPLSPPRTILFLFVFFSFSSQIYSALFLVFFLRKYPSLAAWCKMSDISKKGIYVQLCFIMQTSAHPSPPPPNIPTHPPPPPKKPTKNNNSNTHTKKEKMGIISKHL